MKVFAFAPETKRAWEIQMSFVAVKKYDNGHLVSIGLEVGKDITEKQLARFDAKEIGYDTWKHSGCLSRCIKRGDDKCQW